MNQALYAHMNNKRKMKKKKRREALGGSLAGPLLWEKSLLLPERPHCQPEEARQASNHGCQLDHCGWRVSFNGKL
jgi:hypothetical protein